MRNTAKLGLTALMAAALLATAISTATARNLSITEQNIRATFRSLEFASELLTIRCPVTLEGSFTNRTIAKVERTLIGAITNVPVKEDSCTNGRARAKGFPYHLTYEGFTGTLPNITSIRVLLNRVLFELIVPGVCTGDYGRPEDNISGIVAVGAGGALGRLEPATGRNIANRLNAGSGLCPSRGTFLGVGDVMRLNSTTVVSVRLI